MRDLVLVGAVVAEGAVAFAEGFAEGSVGVKAKTVFAAEEICKGEVVGLEGGGGWGGLRGRRGARDCSGHVFLLEQQRE